MSFKPISHLSTTVAAIDQIERQVKDGTLRPGDKLPPERELAEMLGVSRPTVREALRALSLLGIIIQRQGSGNYLSDLESASLAQPMRWLVSLAVPARDVPSVLELRATLESGVARLAAGRITDDQLAELDELYDRLKVAQSDQDVLRLDMQMHDIVADASGNDLLTWILQSIQEINVVARSRTIKAAGVKEEVASDQRRILDALGDRDPDASYHAMWDHLQRIEDAFTADSAT